jgi:peptidoglycan/LPS O-acetylase OafA/YrhL
MSRAAPDRIDPPAPEFLSGPMSSLVDLVRMVSAFAVVVYHSLGVGFHSGQPYVGPLGSHYAVVVFFVVSGLAVGTGASRPGTTLAEYALARAVRIMPVALLAMALGLFVFALRGPVPVIEPYRGHETLTWHSVIDPLLFMTESAHGQLPVWNAPWWSLSYEVWYYALFGVALFLQGSRRLIWLLALGWLAGPQILLLMPIWLMGAMLARSPGLVNLPRRAGAGLLIAGLATFLLARTVDMPALAWLQVRTPIPLVNSQNVIGNTLVGLAVALGLAGARPWLPLLARPIALAAPALRWGAGMTFTAYLTHQPLIAFACSWGIVAPAGVPGAVLALVGILAVCALLASLCERRSPALRRSAQRWLARVYRREGQPPAVGPLPA